MIHILVQASCLNWTSALGSAVAVHGGEKIAELPPEGATELALAASSSNTLKPAQEKN